MASMMKDDKQFVVNEGLERWMTDPVFELLSEQVTAA